MIIHRYVVTGAENSTIFFLRKDKLATGFLNNADKFLESHKAQIAADKENASKIWNFQWKVEQKTFEVTIKPHYEEQWEEVKNV